MNAQIKILVLITVFFVSFNVMAKSDALSEGWTLGFGVDYSLTGREFVFSSGKNKSNNSAITANLQYEVVPLLSVQVMRSKKDSFGFYFKYSYIPQCSLSGGKVKINGATVNATSETDVDSFTSSVIHIGSLYRFDKWIVPFGMAIMTAPTYTQKTANVGLSRGFGFGYEISGLYTVSSHLALEVGYRALSTSYGQMTAPASNVYEDYGAGYTSEVILGVKYFL